MLPATEPLRLAPLDDLPEGICVVSEGYLVVFWNRQLERWTGIPREQILGQDARERFPRLGEGELAEPLRRALAGESTDAAPGGFGIVRGPDPDGSPRSLRARALPFPALDVRRYALLQVQDLSDVLAPAEALRSRLSAAERQVEELSAQLLLEQAGAEQRVSELEKRLERQLERGAQPGDSQAGGELAWACRALDRVLETVEGAPPEPPSPPAPGRSRSFTSRLPFRRRRDSAEERYPLPK